MHNQHPIPSTTVVQKPNQGATENVAVYTFSGSFFGSFLEKQERTRKNHQKNGDLNFGDKESTENKSPL
jgi:hypothetical protein